jgi:hypothetical protein
VVPLSPLDLPPKDHVSDIEGKYTTMVMALPPRGKKCIHESNSSDSDKESMTTYSPLDVSQSTGSLSHVPLLLPK